MPNDSGRRSGDLHRPTQYSRSLRHVGDGASFAPGDRQRFTVAHDLGHLCLHSEMEAPRASKESRAIESQAHRLAAAFLTPADAVIESLSSMGGKVTLRTLEDLKVEWGFAIKAFVTRLKHLGVIEDGKATYLFRQISSRGWNNNEPVHVANEQGSGSLAPSSMCPPTRPEQSKRQQNVPALEIPLRSMAPMGLNKRSQDRRASAPRQHGVDIQLRRRGNIGQNHQTQRPRETPLRAVPHSVPRPHVGLSSG